MNLQEAILFRNLVQLFGEDRVMFRMSLMAVCGGQLPDIPIVAEYQLSQWARVSQCLFTVIDRDDNPRLVVEFYSGFEESVVVEDVEHQRFLKPILEEVGIRYVTISNSEFCEITDSRTDWNLCRLLIEKFGLIIDD